jgi:hypothetical protein
MTRQEFERKLKKLQPDVTSYSVSNRLKEGKFIVSEIYVHAPSYFSGCTIAYHGYQDMLNRLEKLNAPKP